MPQFITTDWLRKSGWQRSTDGPLAYWSKLIPPVNVPAAEIEIAVDSNDIDEGGWNVAFYQRNPDEPNGRDDHVLVTTKTFRFVEDILKLIEAIT